MKEVNGINLGKEIHDILKSSGDDFPVNDESGMVEYAEDLIKTALVSGKPISIVSSHRSPEDQKRIVEQGTDSSDLLISANSFLLTPEGTKHLLEETVKFINRLPHDLGKGSLNGEKVQLAFKIEQWLEHKNR